ncbi:TetR/AcrR family transcriptional regulator [Pedobacter nyackensis]|uniref:TetR/AcrR family transcriptional regulator n=1 Tax=Pedobacter nyackensis TaxID=475255 RepID=UPI00292FA810|nr:TetR/AcrR family transcriptional regulator [Pedobacter nyackensis]
MARKIPEGEIRNKERTKLKLIHAVGEIIRVHGYTKLGVNRIADTADVSKKLIYRYFGSVENLIEIYVKQKDYWILFPPDNIEDTPTFDTDQGKELSIKMFHNLFRYLSAETEMQKILIWEISEKTNIMKEVTALREKLGSDLFKMIDSFFEKSDADFRATYAIILGGIYYMILHSNGTGGPFCEIDIKNPSEQARIEEVIRKLISWTYQEAKNTALTTDYQHYTE